jgi:hypothetical protein
MANPYFTAAPLTVYDGDIAKASDLNNLSVAVETAFDLGDQILQTIVSDTAALISDADADVALTHADVVLTHADVVLTHADVVLTHADASASEISRLASGVSAGESEAAKVISVAQADTATAQAVIATNKAAEAAASAASITPVAEQIHAAASKSTPADADEFGGADSAAAFGLKKYSWATIKTAILATWKDATGGLVGLTLFKINFSNAANTFISFLTNANTASRTYTFQDRDGTITDDTDLALKVSTSAIGVAAGNVQQVDQAETSVASATSITLATTLNQLLTGTTPVDTINSVAGRTNRIRVETGGFALNHSAGLNCLQTGATITTAAGDTFKWFALTASTGFVFDYVRASGVGLKKIASYYRSAANEGIPGHGDGVNTTQVIFTIPTPMRYLTPVTGVSASDPSHFSIGDGTTNIVCTNIAFASGGVGSVRISVTVAAGAAQYRTYLLFFNNALGTLTFTGQTYE